MLKKLFNPESAALDLGISSQASDESSPPQDEDITASQSTENHEESVESQVGEETDLIPVAEVEVTISSASSTDIQAVRDLILASHHNIVPELIAGDSVDALIASVEPAKAAYSRIIANVRVPAGGNAPVTVDVETLPTFDKIRRGLANPGS